MTEEQGYEIIKLLEEIRNKLSELIKISKKVKTPL